MALPHGAPERADIGVLITMGVSSRRIS